MGGRRFDAVFLDAGGVLVSPSPGQIVAGFGDAGYAVDPEAILSAHYHGVQAIDVNRSEPEDFRHYLRTFVTRLGLADDEVDHGHVVLEGLWASTGLWCEPLEWAAAGLRAIADLDLPIVVVSNADGSCETVLMSTGLVQVGPGAGTEVAAIIDSGLVGVAKPDPAIFRIALDLVGAAPDRAIHVGDSYQYDVRGARAAGIHPVLVDPLGIRDDADCDRVATLLDVIPLLTYLS